MLRDFALSLESGSPDQGVPRLRDPSSETAPRLGATPQSGQGVNDGVPVEPPTKIQPPDDGGVTVGTGPDGDSGTGQTPLSEIDQSIDTGVADVPDVLKAVGSENGGSGPSAGAQPCLQVVKWLKNPETGEVRQATDSCQAADLEEAGWVETQPPEGESPIAIGPPGDQGDPSPSEIQKVQSYLQTTQALAERLQGLKGAIPLAGLPQDVKEKAQSLRSRINDMVGRLRDEADRARSWLEQHAGGVPAFIAQSEPVQRDPIGIASSTNEASVGSLSRGQVDVPSLNTGQPSQDIFALSKRSSPAVPDLETSGVTVGSLSNKNNQSSGTQLPTLSQSQPQSNQQRLSVARSGADVPTLSKGSSPGVAELDASGASRLPSLQ